MSISKFCSIILLGAAAAIALPAFAQQAVGPDKGAPATQPGTSATDTTAADTTAADNAEAAATAAAIAKANAAAAAAGAKSSAKPLDTATVVKKATQSGWRPEVQNGNTVYCRNDPEVGSRFTKRRCVSEMQLANLIEQAEFDKDQLKQRGCGGSCGGK
jgi:hypothetical protein